MYNDDLNKYINTNYEQLRKMLKYEWRKMETTEFDEDIFHDTLIKCMDKFNDKEFIENDFKAYIVTSFKMNVIRSKQYHDNSMRSDTDIETIDYEETNQFNCDFVLILKDVKETFGSDSYEKFLDWLEDKSIKEINEEYNCKNTRYLIDKVKEYIKSKYNIRDQH